MDAAFVEHYRTIGQLQGVIVAGTYEQALTAQDELQRVAGENAPDIIRAAWEMRTQQQGGAA